MPGLGGCVPGPAGGGVPGPGGWCAWLRGWCAWSGGVCLVQGGVPGPGWGGGVCLVWGGGVPDLRGGLASQHAVRQTPPVDRITDTCKNITLAQLRCGR